MALEEFNHFFQESILSDLKNGVNPQSKKKVFHITRDNMYDSNDLVPDDMIFKTFKPRVPSFATNTKDSSGFASSDDGKYKEDGTTPRICVSPSIEGCLNSLRLYLRNSDNPRRVKQEFSKGVWYVYTPLQDLSKYSIKSNSDIVNNGLVWDAKYTKETWILEDATMVLYGIIKVDDVSDPMTKQNPDIRKPGTYRLRENMEGRFSFSWHWVKSNEMLMRDKRIADIIKNAKEKQSNDKTFKPDIPKTGKRKQDEIDRDKRIASAKEYNDKVTSYEKQIRDFNTKLSKMINDINSDKSDISEKEFRSFWDSGKKLRKEWKRFIEEDDDTEDMFPDELLNRILNNIKKNKSKLTAESYIDDDDTSGTSDFDINNDNDPDDCYCESFDIERLSPDIQLRPADKYYLDDIIEWKMQTIFEGYPDEQPSTEEYNKISNYVKNEIPKMLDDTRIVIYDNDQPIGMIIAYQKDQDWFIDDIFLIPEFRHKGIGRMILENEISNHNQLALWVYKSNIYAISLYESLGFKVEEAIKERQMMRLRKTDIEMTKGWRVTYQGIGIYEALKNAMFTQTGSPAAWMAFINSDACNWLPKPPSYGNDNKSFFTEEGLNRFNELVLPIIVQYIDQTKIYIEEIMVPTNQIIYSDEFQFVTSDTIQESTTIPRSNAVYTNGGNIEKINDFPFDKVYFGSPNKLPTTMKLDGPLFVSPYPGIASIFSVRPQNLQKYGVPNGVRCNRDYDEWNRSLKDTVLQKPLTELHVRIQAENIKIKPTTELVSGYLYTIDVTPEIRDHIYQSSKMSKVFEFCIDKMNSVTFSDIKKINVRMTVTGENIHIQEAYDVITGEEIPIDHAYTMDEMKERTYTEEELMDTVQEAKLPSKKRNALDDSDFALVYTDTNGKKIRKYPVHDKAHVESAARMFPRGVPLKYQGKVARKILRRAHEFGIDTSGWKNLNKFKERD